MKRTSGLRIEAIETGLRSSLPRETPKPGMIHQAHGQRTRNASRESLCTASHVHVHTAAFGAAEVPLVVEGKPVTEIVLARDATPSVRTAARELQRHLRAMSVRSYPSSMPPRPV